jgi:starvation-inducible DNA-binding protein
MPWRIARHSVQNTGLSSSLRTRTIFAGFQHFRWKFTDSTECPPYIYLLVEGTSGGMPTMLGAPARHVVFRRRISVGKDISDHDSHPCLSPTRIDIPAEIRLYVIGLLNQTLACTVDLRSQVKQASWNVKGKETSQLQALFDSIATELDTYADLMAERLVVLGGVALGTARAAAAQSTLQEYPCDIAAGDAHVLALAERFAPYSTAMRGAIAHATDVGDAGTAGVYTDISRGIDKRLQVLEAHLHR